MPNFNFQVPESVLHKKILEHFKYILYASLNNIIAVLCLYYVFFNIGKRFHYLLPFIISVIAIIIIFKYVTTLFKTISQIRKIKQKKYVVSKFDNYEISNSKNILETVFGWDKIIVKDDDKNIFGYPIFIKYNIEYRLNNNYFDELFLIKFNNKYEIALISNVIPV